MSPVPTSTPFTDFISRLLDPQRLRAEARERSAFWTTREFHDRHFVRAAGQRGDRQQITRDELQQMLKDPALPERAHKGLEYLLDPGNAHRLKALEERSGKPGDGSFTRRDLMHTIKDLQREMHRAEAEAPTLAAWKTADLVNRYCREVVKTGVAVPRPKPPEVRSTQID